MVMNSSNFVGMDIFFNKFFSIFNGSTLSLIYNTSWFVCNIFPKTNVHIFRTWKHIISIHRVWNWTYDLHSFSVINLSATALIIIENSDCSIEWPSYKLSSCWREVQISYSSDVVFVNDFSFVHSSQIKAVTVWIIISYCKVNRLEWIKSHTHTFIWKCYFLYWTFSP